MSLSLENLLRAAGSPRPERAEALWARYRDAGDDAAFTTLVGWYGAGIYRRALFILGFDHPLAEEAFQTAFGKLHERRHSPGCATFAAALAWLRTTAANEARMALRCRRRARAREWKAALDPPTASAPDTETEVLRTELLAELATAFNRLCRGQQEAIALRYFEGRTIADAAAVMGCNRETLARRVEQGLGRLRKLLTARGVAPAAGGVVAVEAVLTDAVRATTWPPGKTAALAAAILARVASAPVAIPQIPGWKKLAIVAAVGGLSVGGWTWATKHEVAAPAVAQRQSEAAAAHIETVPEQNLRVFQSEVLPKQLATLRLLAIGGGEVELESVGAYDTRVDCTYRIRHRFGGTPGWRSRLQFIHNTIDHGTEVYFDLHGRGERQPIDTKRPIVLRRSPATKAEVVLKVPALEEARAAFARLPQDERTAAERRDHTERLRSAIAPFLGTWYVRGDPSRQCAIWLGPDGWLHWRTATGQQDDCPLTALRSDADARGFAWSLASQTARSSADGWRIVFDETGDWWSREPISEPQK